MKICFKVKSIKIFRDTYFAKNNSGRIFTIISKVRTNYLRTVSPSLSIRTFQYLRCSVGFGDWLLLIMMSHNLDVKLFTDILAEIGRLIIRI